MLSRLYRHSSQIILTESREQTRAAALELTLVYSTLSGASLTMESESLLLDLVNKAGWI